MFKITNNQLATLSLKGREEFIKSMAKLLCSEDEDIKNIPKQELYDYILKLIKKSNKYKFTLNSSIASFIVTAFSLGENFDVDFEAAREILTSVSNEEEKGQKLQELVINIFSALENS
ncbi:MAG: hypothetical protein JWQ09_428 [Segetibacter sp.]|nr:hypothetical protein [Segetibacter sp.]